MWLLISLAIILVIIYYFASHLNYWNKKGVPQSDILWYSKERILIFFKRKSLVDQVLSGYNQFPNKRYGGIFSFSRPILMIRDPELLKELTVKSFDHFTDHSTVIPVEVEPLWSRNLFALKGQKWRDMRAILSPSFTSSKMRTLFELISDCAQNFSQHFLTNNQEIVNVELKDIFTRFTNDVIATSSFGIKINSMEDQTNEFYRMGKKLTSFGNEIIEVIKMILLAISPKLFSVMKLTIFDKKIITFFIDIIKDTVKIRKEKGIVRPDMIHLLITAQKGLESKEEIVVDSSFAAQEEINLGDKPSIKEQKELTNIDIAAQALIFFFAGFETVSTLMCFMGYELAANPEIQSRLREEIEDTLNECRGDLSYETLLKMKYMDMVVSETLRKWPPVVTVDRECTKPYKILPKFPEERPVYLEEKSLLWIPTFAIHRDPKYYADPERFDPERFNDENKNNILPYSYLPFGLGPRNCIGSRFALMEIKIVFFHLLRHFEIVPTSKSQIPVKIAKASFNFTAEGGFWFGLRRLEK